MFRTRHLVPALALLCFLSTLANAQTPLRLVPATPCRLVDTRPSNGGGGPIQGGTAQSFDLPSLASQKSGCPNLANAAAYSLNVTVIPSGGLGYLTIWPTGESQPLVSLMNSPDGRIKANAAIVPAGTNGAVSIYVSNTTNVAVDIDGYFDSAADSSSLAFFPLTPCRVVDTRSGNGGALQAGVERDFPIPGTCSIPSDAQGYSFNFTVVPISNHPIGYLSVWPAGGTRPVVSTLNDPTGTIVANAAIVPAGSENKTAVYSTDNTNLLIDVNGYYAPANSGTGPLSLYTLTPCRVLDTRKGVGLISNGQISVPVVGSSCGISSTSQGFVFNATVVPNGSLSYLTLWPEGENKPTVSTLNALDGAIASNMAIVPTQDGAIDAYAAGSTQLIIDISSYFAPIPAVGVLTSTLPDGTQNQAYSVSLVADGGVAPYTWTLNSGSLPSGMSLSNAGVISGTPTGTGPSNFVVKVTDSGTPASTATANLSITVDSSMQTLGVTTSALPATAVNVPYNALLTANGGITPYTWSISAGALPPGVTLNASTGQISGLAGSPGLYELTAKVTDAQHSTATKALSIAVTTGDGNPTLNGHYALTFQGYARGSIITVAASLIFDGGGHVTGGEEDINKAGSGVEHDTVTGGTYSIASNGLGTINFTDSSGGNIEVLVETAAAEDMRVIAYNQNGSNGTWGAGVVRQQNPTAFNPASLAGNWAFGLQGFDSSQHPLASDGFYKQDASGNITHGAEDINDFGTDDQATFTGRVTTSIDGNGRSIVQLVVNGTPLNYAAYMVSANEVMLVHIDNGDSLTITDALRQSGTMNNGILHGKSVGNGSRQHSANGNANSQAIILLFDADGNGNVTITQDTNTNGAVQHDQSGPATYSVSSNGRTMVASGSTVVVCYMVALNQGFCINTGSTSAGAGVIAFEPQTTETFTNASFVGEFLGGSLPQYVPDTYSQVDTNLADGNGNFAETYTDSGPNGTNPNQNLTGTYTVSSQGEITISQGGNVIYYAFIVSPNKYVAISGGANPLTMIEYTSSAPRHH